MVGNETVMRRPTLKVLTLEYVGIHYPAPDYPGVAVASKILPEAAHLPRGSRPRMLVQGLDRSAYYGISL